MRGDKDCAFAFGHHVAQNMLIADDHVPGKGGRIEPATGKHTLHHGPSEVLAHAHDHGARLFWRHLRIGAAQVVHRNAHVAAVDKSAQPAQALAQAQGRAQRQRLDKEQQNSHRAIFEQVTRPR